MSDRYMKVILTIIALELLWIGVKDGAPPVIAQGAAQPVIIRGIDIAETTPPTRRSLPVAIVGATIPIRVEPERTFPVDFVKPVKIEADSPLRVESVPYTPSRKPGE